MLIQERVKLIIKANGATPSSFADRLGLNRSNLSHILSGRNKPSLDFLAKVIENYPRVNASWLITGVTREELASSEKEKTIDTAKASKANTDKELIKVVMFYADNTFTEYTPSVSNE